MAISRTLLTGFTSLVATATLLAPGVAAADTDTSEPAADAVVEEQNDGARRARLERACNRAPRIKTRATNILDRINGTEDERGSLLWLDAKAAEARDNGRDQLATVIENRRNTRAAAIEVIELRLVEVDNIITLCDDNGLGQ